MTEDMEGMDGSTDDDKKPEEKPKNMQEAMEQIRSLREETIKNTLAEGSFDDLCNSVKDVDETVVTWEDKYYPVVFKWMGWTAQNQLKERLLRDYKKLPKKHTATEYKRKYQEEMMYKMVLKISETPMQDSTGEPMEANWARMPAPIGEYLRQFFFSETGEIAEAVEEGTGMNLDDLIEFLNRLKEEDNGIVAERDGKIKK